MQHPTDPVRDPMHDSLREGQHASDARDAAAASRPRAADPRGCRTPRYLALAEAIGRDIAAGVHAVGTLLPSEAELCARYQVSRHTVREATRVLQEQGMVVRHQGLGTRICAARAASRYVLAMDAIPDLWEYVKNTRLEVVRRRLIRASDALTPLPAGTARWRMIEAVRYAHDGEPIAWKQVYIDARYDAAAAEVGKRTVPIYSLIEARYALTTEKVQQEISAMAIPAAAASALRVEVGSSGLAILRHYRDGDDRVFEVTLSIYPAERFRYSVELKLEYGAGSRRATAQARRTDGRRPAAQAARRPFGQGSDGS